MKLSLYSCTDNFYKFKIYKAFALAWVKSLFKPASLEFNSSDCPESEPPPLLGAAQSGSVLGFILERSSGNVGTGMWSQEPGNRVPSL